MGNCYTHSAGNHDMPQPHIRHHTPRSAFTLVEVAIVLVIIGLLIGGVLQGKAMLEQARLQSVLRDLGKYRDAYAQFVTVYGCKPGDMGAAGASVCVNKASDKWAGVTDGDGNGYIGGPYKADTTLTNTAEIYAAWQQLAAAGLMEGKYTGAAGTGATLGVNVPASQVTGAGYVLVSQDPVNAATSAKSPNYFYGDYGSAIRPGAFIIFGAANTTANGGLTDGELLSPIDAYSVDRKADDGLPAVGTVMTYLSYPSGVANSCVVNTTSGVAPVASDGRAVAYNTTAKGRRCNLIYINDATK